jgi:rare lipoprotein A
LKLAQTKGNKMKKGCVFLIYTLALTALCAAEGKTQTGNYPRKSSSLYAGEKKIQKGSAICNEGDRSLKAAHAKLALGTRIRITNQYNHRDVIVTVNRRIPDDPEGMVQVGTLAADNIGISRDKPTPVFVEILGRKKWPETNAEPLTPGESSPSLPPM